MATGPEKARLPAGNGLPRGAAGHNRFRGLLVRWERIGSHYLALLHLAWAFIAFRQAV